MHRLCLQMFTDQCQPRFEGKGNTLTVHRDVINQGPRLVWFLMEIPDLRSLANLRNKMCTTEYPYGTKLACIAEPKGK